MLCTAYIKILVPESLQLSFFPFLCDTVGGEIPPQPPLLHQSICTETVGVVRGEKNRICTSSRWASLQYLHREDEWKLKLIWRVFHSWTCTCPSNSVSYVHMSSFREILVRVVPALSLSKFLRREFMCDAASGGVNILETRKSYIVL